MQAEAADLVNTYVETYLGVRREQQVEELLAASDEIQTRLGQGMRERSRRDQRTARLPGLPDRGRSGRFGPEQADLEQQDARQPSRRFSRSWARCRTGESTYVGQLQQLEVARDLTAIGRGRGAGARGRT